MEGQDPWYGPVRHTSDYFDVLYQCALSLIDQDKAYVDFLSAAQMAEYRGSLTVPGRNSPDRELNRTPAEVIVAVELVIKEHSPQSSFLSRMCICTSTFARF